jgi:hypothetical protein
MESEYNRNGDGTQMTEYWVTVEWRVHYLTRLCGDLVHDEGTF